MASCTRIEHSLQSFIDGELSDSERVIVESHLHDCTSCSVLLKQHKQCNAEIFEAFAPRRFNGDMKTYVIEHLPEMITAPKGSSDLEQVNRRAKNPFTIADRFKQLAPLVAAVLIICLAYVLKANWPETVIPDSVLGSVTYENGQIYKIDARTDQRSEIGLKSFVLREDRFETDSDSHMMITLLGPTHVKLAPNTRIRVQDNRRIRVEKGRVFLDVAKDSRVFRVLTPNGTVTVFGTSFEVDVQNDELTVSVAEGEVQVEQGDLFTQVLAGEQVRVTPEIKFMNVKEVDVFERVEWSNAIVPDVEAEHYFTTQIAPAFVPEVVVAERVYRIVTYNTPISYLELEWEPKQFDERIGYHVYVYTEKDEFIFSGAINAAKLANRNDSKIRIYNRAHPKMKTDAVHVKIFADTVGGEGDLDFTHCSAKLLR